MLRWTLRDQHGCEFPGEPTPGPVYLRVLDSVVTDARTGECPRPAPLLDPHFICGCGYRCSAALLERRTFEPLLCVGRPASDLGFGDDESVCSAEPWAMSGASIRKMLFVNAYNHSEFSRWSKGRKHDCPQCVGDIGETDFAAPT